MDILDVGRAGHRLKRPPYAPFAQVLLAAQQSVEGWRARRGLALVGGGASARATLRPLNVKHVSSGRGGRGGEEDCMDFIMLTHL